MILVLGDFFRPLSRTKQHNQKKLFKQLVEYYFYNYSNDVSLVHLQVNEIL